MAVVVDPPFAIERAARSRRSRRASASSACSRRTRTPTTCPGTAGSRSSTACRSRCIRSPSPSSSRSRSQTARCSRSARCRSACCTRRGTGPSTAPSSIDERIVLTGDSLFVGDAARPDLAVAAREGAEDLYASLSRLAELPPGDRGLPRPRGGLALRRQHEQRPVVDDRPRVRDEPVARRSATSRTSCSSRRRSRPRSRRRPRASSRSTAGRGSRSRHDPPELAAARRGDGARRAHLRRARGRPPARARSTCPVSGGSFGTKAGFVLDAARVASSCTPPSAEQALEAARKLWAVGILELEGFVVQPAATETLATVRPDELKLLLEQAEVQVVDVRETTERDSGYLPGSRNIPYRLIRKLGCGALERDRPVVTICESGAARRDRRVAAAARGIRRARGRRRRHRRTSPTTSSRSAAAAASRAVRGGSRAARARCRASEQ